MKKNNYLKILKNFINTYKYPEDYSTFYKLTLLMWLFSNLLMILIYGIIYYLYDYKNHVSNFDGLKDGKRYFYEYLYLASMVGTLVGFGDVVAKRDAFTKFIIISQVIVSLFVNYAIISFKELKLADDP